jgi:hypothetical protein
MYDDEVHSLTGRSEWKKKNKNKDLAKETKAGTVGNRGEELFLPHTRPAI